MLQCLEMDDIWISMDIYGYLWISMDAMDAMDAMDDMDDTVWMIWMIWMIWSQYGGVPRQPRRNPYGVSGC